MAQSHIQCGDNPAGGRRETTPASLPTSISVITSRLHFIAPAFDCPAAGFCDIET